MTNCACSKEQGRENRLNRASLDQLVEGKQWRQCFCHHTSRVGAQILHLCFFSPLLNLRQFVSIYRDLESLCQENRQLVSGSSALQSSLTYEAAEAQEKARERSSVSQQTKRQDPRPLSTRRRRRPRRHSSPVKGHRKKFPLLERERGSSKMARNSNQMTIYISIESQAMK